MITVGVDFSKFEAVMAQLSPEELDRRARSAMNESLAYLQGEVAKAIPVGVSGNTRQALFTEIRGKALPEIRGIVANPFLHTIVLEKGRKPGRMPPVEALRLWCQRKLGNAKLAFVVARAIGKKGTKAWRETKGLHMFENAAKNGQATVNRIWQKWFRL